MFKFLNYCLASFIISAFLCSIYIFFPNLLDQFDAKFRDAFFIERGAIKTSQNVVIVDIDEASIKEFGQWPWSRDKLAKIIENLTLADVLVVGLDIVFAEPDRTSPRLIAKTLGINENLDDYDLVFSEALANSPTILGYNFDLVDENSTQNAPQIAAVFVERDKQNDMVLKAFGANLNIPILQDSGYSSGFFNIVPDDSGVIRSVPLVISYEDVLYPSLSLEMIRAATGANRVVVDYDVSGVYQVSFDEFKIPTDRFGRMFINYRGGQKSFKYISAKDIFYNTFDKADISGKFVLLGTSANGIFDLRTTPFESVFPGVEVHANIIDNIITGDFIHKPSYADGLNILIIITLSFSIVLLTTFLSFYFKIFSFFIASFGYLFACYYALFTHGIIINIVFGILSIILSFMTALIFDYFYNIKSEKAIKEKFASKVSKSVMEDILKHQDNHSLNIKNKEVTIFFSDIRGFTQISEKLDATALIGLLNRYMQPMSEIIIKYQGTIDKFIGDAVMAYWNAPLDIKDHADKAVTASLEQLNALNLLNDELKKDGLPTIKIGIGLNTGNVVVGEMGCEIRSDYTVIGDAINLGSRVESLCKFYGSNLSITNFTKDKLTDRYIFRFLDAVKVKGKNEPVEIYQVLGLGDAVGELKDELDRYHEAIKIYQNADFKGALAIFNELKNSSKDNHIYALYAQRCADFIANPPENFNGVYEHTTKG